ncbi:apolipoprotein A-II isoform X2 [Epinephelus fuscoguttatus]|uniref:apolipoprotein A-II isoform X2 n=1 Tax=Epinephelus fuscoguttatus TaxID=293821 RepID=UPI0020D1E395|nr:apolipoprotein A-II isoform X2 [Epinephelus fuscoguttatus]XP_049439221.1 apolipoprotein A-II isoform X2 [Epinephelus fuscoguttatus]
MNAKYALALILALQVSVSLCEIPAPSQELVQKYDELKATFYKRLLNLCNKLQDAAAPMVENVGDGEQGQAVKDCIEELLAKPELQAFVKVLTGLGQEAGPLVDKARTSVLGAYEYYLRPYIGTSLNDSIDTAKVYLDQLLPAE